MWQSWASGMAVIEALRDEVAGGHHKPDFGLDFLLLYGIAADTGTTGLGGLCLLDKDFDPAECIWNVWRRPKDWHGGDAPRCCRSHCSGSGARRLRFDLRTDRAHDFRRARKIRYLRVPGNRRDDCG